MTDLAAEGRVLVLSKTWEREETEAAFVMRHIAAALGRGRPVDVLIPGPLGAERADGAFDVVGAGGTPAVLPRRAGTGTLKTGADGTWPMSGEIPCSKSPPSIVVLESDDTAGVSLARRTFNSVPVVAVGSGKTVDPADYLFSVIPTSPEELRTSGTRVVTTGMHVPINPLARTRRHNGLGFVGYVLLLGDITASSNENAIEWLVTSMTRVPVVAVVDAVASVYRTRSLLGRVAVDTRTDLWRLMAFACVVIDLAPGFVLGRECIEAQRLGTPTIAPANSSGALIGATGGGLWFDDVAQLLACVDTVRNKEVGRALGAAGMASSNRWFGDPEAWVKRVADAVDFVIADHASTSEQSS